MTNVSDQVVLPPDTGERSLPEPATWEEAFQTVESQVAQFVTVPTVPKPVATSTFLDENGVPHMVVPLTAHTKAIIGTSAAFATTVGVSVASFLPDGPYKAYILAAVGVIGTVGTFLGITLPTNLPKVLKK